MTGIDFEGDLATAQADADYAAEQAANSVLWTYNNEQTITVELKGVADHCNNFANGLAKMVDTRDYYKLDGMQKALISNDLGPGGWIPDFVQNNSEDLTVPETQVMLTGGDSVIKAYAACRKYIQDLATLNIACEKMCEIVREFHLWGLYGRLTWIANFKKSTLDTAKFGRLDCDIEALNYIFNTKVTDIPDKKSSTFYTQYQDRLIAGGTPMSRDELKRKYREERMKDYQDFVDARGMDSFIYRGNGKWDLVYDWYSDMQVVDNYTRIATQAEPHSDDIEEYRDKVIRVINECLVPNQKSLTMKNCQSVNNAFLFLAKTMRDIAQECLDELDKLLDGGDAPYCWMHVPGALKEVKPAYKFNPSKEEPFGNGTEYAQLYLMAIWSFEAQCKEFVYNSGIEHLRD